MSRLREAVVNRRDLFHSRPFRMAGLYAGVFAALSAVTLALMLWLYRQEARSELEAALDRESAKLEMAYQERGIDGVRDYAEALRLQPLGERWSVKLESGGQHIEIPASPRQAAMPEVEARSRSLQLGPQVQAQLQVSTQLQRESLRLLGRALATGIILLVLLALAGGVLLAWLTNRRISHMDRALAGIMAGNLSSRMPVRARGDELDRLATNVNRALDQVQQLMETVRSATDGIAHDLRTPLARHRGRLEQALREPPMAEALPHWLEDAIAEVDNILATFRGLMQIATVEAGALRSRFVPVELEPLVEQMLGLYEPLANERGLVVQAELTDGVRVQGLRDLLSQSLANLLDNAIKFSPPGGHVRVSLRSNGRDALLSVSDDGPGIPEAEHERVFQRLYRLDASRSTPGLGLGLSLVKAVMELHNGRVRIDADSPGTTVSLMIPRI